MSLIEKEPSSQVPTRPLPHLLLVEDNADLANLTAEFLRLSGMEVQIAECGDRALKLAAVFRPQIVLCDLSLPDMSGLDVVRRLRADPETQNAVFGVCTAMSKADIDIFEEACAGEVDLFLSKPITAGKVNDLFNCLQRPRATSKSLFTRRKKQ